MLNKLNLGCGESKIDTFINVDFEASVKPEVVCDFRKQRLPFPDGHFELVHLLHVIEHIEMRYWDHVFGEVRRVMKDGAEFRIAYPEFEIASKYFLENYENRRPFWRNVLYGRQLYPGDYHIVPMMTSEIREFLTLYGFHNIQAVSEPEEWNTFVTCVKGAPPLQKEDILRKEIFGGPLHV
jgi:predicted SAM-dependent methyltransferase